MEIPSIRYARTGDGVRIPYWTRGRGRPLLLSPNVQLGHARAEWSVPAMRRWFERLAGSFTLVRYDHRAGGLSITRGRAPHVWELDALTRDIDAVLEATATGKAVLVGWLAGAIPALAYAARNPDRVSHLVLWNGFARDRSHGQSPRLRSLFEMARTGGPKPSATHWSEDSAPADHGSATSSGRNGRTWQWLVPDSWHGRAPICQNR